MVNYITEDNIDFWDEINNSDTDNSETNDNICLISKEPLVENYITLKCNHKFNYIPLFNEIKCVKLNTNKYYSNYNLKKYEIICSYCRNITVGLLPYIPSLIDEKVRRVNFPIKNCMPLFKCTHKSKKKVCCDSNNAYISNNNIFCLKHHKMNKHITMTDDMLDFSKNNTVAVIKKILKINKKKSSGFKKELVLRIFENNLN